MPLVLLRQVRSMIEIARLSADAYRSIQIKRQFICVGSIPFGLGLDKLVEAIDVLELGVCIKEESGMVRVRYPERVKFLEVCNEVMYPLGV